MAAAVAMLAYTCVWCEAVVAAGGCCTDQHTPFAAVWVGALVMCWSTVGVTRLARIMHKT